MLLEVNFMRSNTARPGVRAAFLLLIVACATAPRRDEQVAARAGVLRAAATHVAPDPEQRAELLGAIDAMESALQRGLIAGDRLNRDFAEASSDPGAELADLQAIAEGLAANRRASLRDMMTARLALRRGMTPAQWRAFADQLPAFDGDLR
jgi:hypothetical protein